MAAQAEAAAERLAVMRWQLSDTGDARACALADRHYSRQTIGAPQMMPPGRKLVFLTESADAVFGSLWPFAEYVRHAWAGAWSCSIFRNESAHLSSELITEALAATRYFWPEPPPLGMVTMVNRDKVASVNPGYCFKKAGFRAVGFTKGGLVVLQLLPEDMPQAVAPLGVTRRMVLA
jgi:hypothetical protein